MTTTTSVLGAVAPAIGGVAGGIGSASAASTQADAAKYAADLQYRMYGEGVQRQGPFLRAGYRALEELEPLSRYKPFDLAQFRADPGYGFRLAEGQKGIERSAAARGGLISPKTLKDLARFNQDLGDTAYGDAFNRYRIERDEQTNALRTLAGVGQTTANTLNTAGANYATSAGQAMGAAADARASGYMGIANAASGSLNQYLNYQNQQAQNAMMQQYIDRLPPQLYST